MKTLRIINQQLNNTELTKDICLEGNDFEIVMKVNRVVKGEDDLFEFDMKQYYGVDGRRDETIIGFVHGKNKAHPIREHEAAFIVGENGQTIKRIYGRVHKY